MSTADRKRAIETAAALTSAAFQGRDSHAHTRTVTYRQMGRRELERMLLDAYARGFRAGLEHDVARRLKLARYMTMLPEPTPWVRRKA